MALLWTVYNGTSRSWTNLNTRTTAREEKKMLCVCGYFSKEMWFWNVGNLMRLSVSWICLYVLTSEVLRAFSLSLLIITKNGRQSPAINTIFIYCSWVSSRWPPDLALVHRRQRTAICIWRNSTDRRTHKIESKTYKTLKLFTSSQFYFFILYYCQQIHNCFTNYHTTTFFDTILPTSGSL